MKLKATYGQTQGDYIMYHNYDTTSLPVRTWFLFYGTYKKFCLYNIWILCGGWCIIFTFQYNGSLL